MLGRHWTTLSLVEATATTISSSTSLSALLWTFFMRSLIGDFPSTTSGNCPTRFCKLWDLFTVPRSFTQVRCLLYYTLSSDSHLSLDLQARNILLRIADPTVLKEAEEVEINQPSSRKITEQTIVVETSDHQWPLERWIGSGSRPVLCDFGEARTGKDSYTGLIQPAVYRAPEVFLHLP